MDQANFPAAGPMNGVAAAPDRRRWLVIGALFAVILAGFLDRISIAVLFTRHGFQQAMGMGFNPTLFGLLMSSFLFAYAISGFLFGFLGDTLGPRRALLLENGVWGLLMAGMGTVSSFGLMLGGRVMLGIAEGPQFSLVNKLVAHWFPANERGRATSIWLVGSPVGSAAGFPLTIWIVGRFGWRASFFVLGAINLFIVVPLILMLVGDRPGGVPAERATPVHPTPVHPTPVHGTLARPTLARPTLARPTLAQVLSDSRRLLRDRDFRFLTAYDCGILIYLWGMNGWLPTYLQRVRHFDTGALGFYAALPFVLLFSGEMLGGWLSDRTRHRVPVCMGGLSGAGILILLATRAATPVEAALLIALSGLFFGLTVPTSFSLAQQVIPSGIMATGIGIFNGTANLAGACAPLVMGWCVSTFHALDAGLWVLVLATLVCSLMLVPLLGRYRNLDAA